MKKLVNLIKRNQVTFLLSFIIIVCLIISVVFGFKLFWGDPNTDKYGGRLEELENIKFTENMQASVTEYFSKNENVNKVTYNIEGKLIYVNIDLAKTVKLTTFKKYVNESLNIFDKELLSKYDIQFIVTLSSDKESKIYPTMGYKNVKKSTITWINS